jgi:hypothetical protein
VFAAARRSRWAEDLQANIGKFDIAAHVAGRWRRTARLRAGDVLIPAGLRAAAADQKDGPVRSMRSRRWAAVGQFGRWGAWLAKWAPGSPRGHAPRIRDNCAKLTRLPKLLLEKEKNAGPRSRNTREEQSGLRSLPRRALVCAHRWRLGQRPNSCQNRRHLPYSGQPPPPQIDNGIKLMCKWRCRGRRQDRDPRKDVGGIAPMSPRLAQGDGATGRYLAGFRADPECASRLAASPRSKKLMGHRCRDRLSLTVAVLHTHPR